MNWPTSASRLASVSFVAVSLLGLASSCEKANDLGLELPGTSPVTSQYLDLPVTAYTVRQQPIETVKANHLLVGRLRDNLVGTTAAKAYVNLLVQPYLSPADSLPAKFSNTKLDSVVFSLAFDQVYGSAAQPLRFDLLPLQQRLDDRTVYNSASSVATGNSLLTNYAAPLNRSRQVWQPLSTNTTNNKDSVLVSVPDRTVRVRMLKQPGTAALANTVFTALKDVGFNQDKLNAVWPGVAIAPAADFGGALVGFNRSAVSRITFYFTGANSDGKTSKYRSYSLFFGNIPASTGVPDSKFFTQLTTDLSGTALASLTTPSQRLAPSATDGYTFVQGGTGLSTRIEFQGLESIRNNANLIINGAELRVPVRPFSNGLLPYPAGLYLYEVNDNNQVLTRTVGATTYERLVVRQGQQSNSAARLTPTTATNAPADFAMATFPSGQDPAQYYSVAVTEYLQAYLQNRLDGELPTGLLLSPILRYNPELNLNRAQLDASKITLRVYYSTLR